MGWVMLLGRFGFAKSPVSQWMSERELTRVEVLSQVSQGRMTATNAANVLGLSRRQVHRLLKTYPSDGPSAIRHKACGRASNNRIDPVVRDFAVTLVQENYIDFGPTFATWLAPEAAKSNPNISSWETINPRARLLGPEWTGGYIIGGDHLGRDQ